MEKNLKEEIIKAEKAIKNIKDLFKMEYTPITTFEEFKDILTSFFGNTSKKTRLTKGHQDPTLEEAFLMQEKGIPIESWKNILKYQKKLKAESIRLKTLND